MMRIVVTGASGFLGRALVQKLAHGSVEVIGVSRKHLPGFVKVVDYGDTPAGDVLVHLAEANDRRWVDTNNGTYATTAIKTLELLIGKGYDRVIYSSSAVLYGDQNDAKCCVGDPVRLVDTYTRLKYASEQAVLDVNGVVARLVNLYGPGMSEQNVLSTILKQMSLEGPVRVLNTRPVRDFLWVEDAAEALVSMILGKTSGVFNVGTGVGSSILDLARFALLAAGQNERLVESVYHATGRSHLVVEISQTTTEFNWKPKIAVSEGIAKLVNTIKE